MGQLVEKKQNALAVGQPTGRGGIEAKDILIPKILLMQPISELVTEGKFSAGDMVRSIDKALVCSKADALEFIPLQFFKMWVIIKKAPGDNRGEFAGIEPYTAQNSDAPREWREGEIRFERNENLCFYGLLPSDIKREQAAFKKAQKSGDLPDSDDSLLPCLIAFQRTSKKAGQVITSHFAKLDDFSERLDKPIPRYISVFNIKSELTKGDKGTYFVYTVEKGRKTTVEEGESCERWTRILGEATVRVDNSDLEEKAASASPVEQPETVEHGGRTF